MNCTEELKLPAKGMNGTLSAEVKRELLSKAVIGNEEAMKKLEAIVHPLVADKKKQLLTKILEEGHHLIIVYDIPLLYETSAEGQVGPPQLKMDCLYVKDAGPLSLLTV